MTQTPKKLQSISPPNAVSQQRILNDGNIVIHSHDELVATFLNDQRFAPYTFDNPSPSVFALTRSELTVFILGPAIWNDEQAFKPFLDNATNPHFAVVCWGKEKEIGTLTHEYKSHPNVHILLMPITIWSLEYQIQNCFKAKEFHRTLSENARQADETSKNVKLVLQISRELNGVRDIPKLLGLILEKAREVTHADAGSIYVVEKETEEKPGSIVFKITQNESVPQNLSEFRLPISDKSIVGNAVIHETAINIPDLYKLTDDPITNPYKAKHDTSWERRIGYECHSMLTLPMFDISHTVIGVIQLINCKLGPDPLRTPKDFVERIIPFNDRAVEYGEIVAHQAGIALENAFLTEQKEALFEGFVGAAINAIEQRDPTTSGHSHRVAKLTLSLAETVNQTQTGIYKDEFFNEKRLKEIEYASLLHDFGKISVREKVLLKAKKLYPWEMDLLLERFELIRSRFEIDYLTNLVNYLQAPNLFPPGLSPEHFKKEKGDKFEKVEEFLEFILKANEPTVLEQGGFERLKDIANMRFKDSRKRDRNYLTDSELKALSVSRGSLTAEEFIEIQNHVTHTYEFLRKIPWGTDLANVPQIAAKHHEKLDGTGYPTSAHGNEIPIQSRMMTIADIFDALTAADRPYKKAVPIVKALDIIEMEVKAKKCDPELFRLFVESKCYKSVV